MVQARQGIRSTKSRPNITKYKQHEATSLPIDTTPSQELHIKVEHIRKLYMNNNGRFPVRSQSGNKYTMIAYHCDSNAIIVAPFNSRANKHRIRAYGAIMKRLKDRSMMVDLQILDNEASTEYKSIIKYEWGVGYKLAPPHIHCRNVAECAIHTFKSHYISNLVGIAPTYPNHLWDLLLTQTELTLNILRQSTLNTKILAWEYFQGPFDFNATPIGPLGCPIMIHQKK